MEVGPGEQLTTYSFLQKPFSGTLHVGRWLGWGLLLQFTGAATLSLQSLTGHTSPVESVRLNTPEELIVAGSQSGSIRVWDLEAAKSRPPPTPYCSFVCGSCFRLGALGCHLQEVWGLCSLSTEQSGWCHPYHVISPAAVGTAIPYCWHEEMPRDDP